jgi:hypothetical protein
MYAKVYRFAAGILLLMPLAFTDFLSRGRAVQDVNLRQTSACRWEGVGCDKITLGKPVQAMHFLRVLSATKGYINNC